MPKNRKIILVVLVTLELLTMFLMYKSSHNNKSILDNKIETKEKEKLAIRVETTENNYEAREDFPGRGYVLNEELTKCYDQEGKKVDNPKITSNGESITITSKETLYCSLYYYLPENREYDYTGDYQVFIASKEGNYQIELWGASGGGAYYSYNGCNGYYGDYDCEKVGNYIYGGRGAYTKGTIHLEKNEKLYIYVGEMGKDYFSTNFGAQPLGGYNGGGKGGSAYQIGGGGGGSKDVRLEISETGNWDDFNSLKSRIMVAGAGGGTSNWYYTVSGGYAGGLVGGPGNLNKDSIEHQLATGGTQISGGNKSTDYGDDADPIDGKFGQGGDSQVSHGGGGGSGYYGGGGGSYVPSGVSSGAGGSSFISGYPGCKAIDKNSTEDHISHLDTSEHYSGRVFTDTLMFAGSEEMPTHDGDGNMIGNTGNGYDFLSFYKCFL